MCNLNRTIFARYDMFLLASREPPTNYDQESTEDRLCNTPGGRMEQAILALIARLQELTAGYHESESDRGAPWDQIQELTRRVWE